MLPATVPELFLPAGNDFTPDSYTIFFNSGKRHSTMLTGIDDALNVIHESLNDEVPLYSEILKSALISADTVFFQKEYADFFWKCASTVPGWIQTVFVQSAVAESHGSRAIFSVWQSVHGNAEAEKGLLLHAKDEARHSKLFLSLVDLAFPGFVPPMDKEEIEISLYTIPKEPQKLERTIPEPILLNYLATVNIAEIRTLINLHLLAPIFYTFAPLENKDRVMKLLHSLQKDEVNHISYSASILNSAARDGGDQFVRDMFKKNLGEFDQYSRKGLGDAVKTYGGGEYFELIHD